jgi:hypothetical protein
LARHAVSTAPPAAGAMTQFLLRQVTARTVEGVRQRHADVLRTELGRLYGDDAIVWMGGLGDGSVDLVFADPPYNAGRESWDSFAGDSAYLTSRFSNVPNALSRRSSKRSRQARRCTPACSCTTPLRRAISSSAANAYAQQSAQPCPQ